MQSGEQELTLNLKNSNIQENLISEIFQVLNPKEQDIVVKRFALQGTKKQTLEEIGQNYGITRERVRQIEKNALTKLARIAVKTSFANIITIGTKIMQDVHYFATEKELLKLVTRQMGGIFIKDNSLIALSFAINPKLELIKKSKTNRKSWFFAKKLNRKQVTTVCTLAELKLKKQNKIVESNEFLSELQEELKLQKTNISKNSISSILSYSKKIKLIDEGYGLTVWRSVKPKSIKDKALIVLNRTKKPLHFSDIANLIHETKFDSKKVTTQAVHNELIRYNEFVLVGRGIYALKEWGFQEGTVKDVITEILTAAGPLNKSQIIEEVLKRRHVKIGTISLNLQKYPEFKRVGRAVYSI